MVMMTLSLQSQHYRTSFFQIHNESKAATREIRAGGTWRAKQEDATKKIDIIRLVRANSELLRLWRR